LDLSGIFYRKLPGLPGCYRLGFIGVIPGLKSKRSWERKDSIMQTGIYRHFKGKEYEVIGIARHSETLEEYVVYRALYGEGGLWIRPFKMFQEPVEVDGKMVPRFELISKA
jgi:hypothetical protein